MKKQICPKVKQVCNVAIHILHIFWAVKKQQLTTWADTISSPSTKELPWKWQELLRLKSEDERVPYTRARLPDDSYSKRLPMKRFEQKTKPNYYRDR